MQLVIETTQKNHLILTLLNSHGKRAARLKKASFKFSECLLPEIKKFLKKHKVTKENLKKILVNPGPAPFSSIRTGVAIANALSYALGILVAEWPSGKIKEMVLPKYEKEPNITKPQKRH